MFALVFDTYTKPLCPAGTHLGMPSMTKTSAGVVETTMTGALTASDAVCDLSEPNAASLLDGASKLIEGCDTAHCAATRRSAVDDCPTAGEATVHAALSADAVIQPSAILSQKFPLVS